MPLDVYADESCKDGGHRYLIIGCTIAPTKNIRALLGQVRAARESGNLFREIKWTKVSRNKLPAYKTIVDAFFASCRPGSSQIHYHALIVDTTKVDNDFYNAGDRELGFTKFVYQLLLKVAERYPPTDHPIYVYLDNRTTRHSTDTLQEILNKGYAKKKNKSGATPFHRVVFRDSKHTDLIQICDLLTGAIGWLKNGHGARPGASPAKAELAKYIQDKVGRDLCRNSPYRCNWFRVWNFKFPD